jgi:hypothetical protein
MRVLISAPRKTGSALLRCLLASSYGLNILGRRDAPSSKDAAAVSSWLADFPDQSIASVDYPWSNDLADTAAKRGIILVGILRHPFDLFVSNYDVAHQRARRKKADDEEAKLWPELAGLELDDPAMLAYARDGFDAEVQWLHGWSESSASIVRFEELDTFPAKAFSSLEQQLGALDSATIDRAVEMCPPESFIVSRPFRGRRMGNLSAGSWRERLPDALKATLRDQYAPDVERLGYEVD